MSFKFISCAAVLSMLFFAVPGCSGGGDEQEEGSILRINIGTEVQDLDPHVTTGVPEHRAASALFEGLTDVDMATMEPVPGVAESWTVSPDGLVYTFKLRENAKWSNGDPLTADEFVYSWKRMLSPELGAEYAYFLYLLKNGEAFNKGELKDFAEVGVQATDPHTLTVTLAHPAPYFLTVHSHQAWYPVHRATLEKFGDPLKRGSEWTRAGNHVGNGPFLLQAWHPSEVIEVRKNPNYWDAANVKLDGINLYPISERQTEERAFRAGELDWTNEVPLHRVKFYLEEHPDQITISPYLGVYYYRLNTTRPELADPRVRRALSMALNREELTTNVLTAKESSAYNFVPPGLKGYETRVKLEYNPETARQLLAEAGYPGGQGFPTLEILYNTDEAHKTIAETVQRMWKEQLGVDVQLLNQDFKVYLENLDNLNYDVARSGWIADIVDPINFLDTMLSYGGNNRTGWKSQAFDELLRQSNNTADAAARLDLLEEAEQVLMDEIPLIPVYFYTRKYLKNPSVMGYAPNPLGYIRWKSLYFDEAER